MTQASDDLIVRPITGPDELDLFCRIPYVLDTELATYKLAAEGRSGYAWPCAATATTRLRGQR